MKKLIVANWKMNPQTYKKAEDLVNAVSHYAKGLRNIDIVLCPPFTWLTDFSHKNRSGISFGAQDVFWEKRGAYTGEISPEMLKNSKVDYVIIGHSERRSLGEADWIINKKVQAAVRGGLRVILCVGEPWGVRKKGIAATKKFVKNQLKRNLKNGLKTKNLVIAYEPVWAIGSGKIDRPQDAGEISCFIKSVVPGVRVLYGGSVTSKNVGGFMMQKEINGALVGGASLSSKEFVKILKTMSK
ncbi:MAG: triose-phosphate isomerase [Patescibacteria group bacterium]